VFSGRILRSGRHGVGETAQWTRCRSTGAVIPTDGAVAAVYDHRSNQFRRSCSARFLSAARVQNRDAAKTASLFDRTTSQFDCYRPTMA
jgi:hypothetical protein